jgi:hypothetical protein
MEAQLAAWLVAQMVPAVADAVVGADSVPAARAAALRAGQFSLLWSAECYEKRALPGAVVTALESTPLRSDLIVALKASATPPVSTRTGVGVNGVVYSGSLKTARAYWLLLHPTCGIERAFDPKPTAPALIAHVFEGDWYRRRLSLLCRAAKHLVAVV